jgi:hypothetical protein
MKPTIIEGYKGVMSLDLSMVDPKYHKIMIAQHKKDIKEYVKYQDELPIQLRYENTTEKALNLLQRNREWLTKLANKKQLEQYENDKQNYEKQQRYLQHLELNSFTLKK